MRRTWVYRNSVYLLCFSFLLSMSGFPALAAEAEEGGLPVGEMLSRGEVKFEPRENVWKSVESGHFPIFPGVRIKTEEGIAFIVLTNESQIEVGHNSLFSLHGEDEFQLFAGQASFRIPPGAELILGVGQLAITRPHPIQAARSPLLVSPGDQETVGSITLHSNGSVTVRGVRGPLSIQNQDRVILASISPGESLTMPSAEASGEEGVILAQVGEISEPGAEGFYGLSTEALLGIGVGTAAIVGAGVAIEAADDDDDDIIIVSP